MLSITFRQDGLVDPPVRPGQCAKMRRKLIEEKRCHQEAVLHSRHFMRSIIICICFALHRNLHVKESTACANAVVRHAAAILESAGRSAADRISDLLPTRSTIRTLCRKLDSATQK